MLGWGFLVLFGVIALRVVLAMEIMVAVIGIQIATLFQLAKRLIRGRADRHFGLPRAKGSNRLGQGQVLVAGTTIELIFFCARPKPLTEDELRRTR